MHSYAAARMATEHLVALGHERILHVAGPRTRNEAFERERGYRDAMAASELAARVVEGVRDWSAASGDQAAREVDPASFTAVFAANDEIALGFMSAMAACGAVAPRDYSIVGVDDMPSAAYFSPPLSSMRLDFRELGIGAFRLLQRLIRTGDRPEHLVLEPTLVLRESTAPPRG
jgi:DNA-binding LacI/PurR family transcriptional regulator